MSACGDVAPGHGNSDGEYGTAEVITALEREDDFAWPASQHEALIRTTQTGIAALRRVPLDIRESYRHARGTPEPSRAQRLCQTYLPLRQFTNLGREWPHPSQPRRPVLRRSPRLSDGFALRS